MFEVQDDSHGNAANDDYPDPVVRGCATARPDRRRSNRHGSHRMSPSAPLSLIIGNLAYAITAAAFLVRNMLWLRVLSAAANAGFLLASLLGPSGGKAPATWSLIFLAINIYQIIDLILERRKVALQAEDSDLHVSAFPNLPHGEFRQLLKIAHRREVPAGTILVDQGQEAADVLLIERGTIELERDGVRLERLRPGHMLGEVAFVAGRPFSSRAIAATPVRLVVWDRERLNWLFERRPAIAIGFHAAFIGRLRRSEPAEHAYDHPLIS
jgi:hypothetical protein